MAYVITCDCGYQARGETEDELVADAEQHMQDKHPEMADEMAREQILALAQEE
jgi:predicted small metal-binding protein